MVIYFLETVDKIKIGITNDYETRKKAYTQYNPDAKLIGTIEGTYNKEAKIKRDLQDYKVKNTTEWFIKNDKVLKYINRFLNGQKTARIVITDQLWEKMQKIINQSMIPNPGGFFNTKLDEKKYWKLVKKEFEIIK